MEQNIPPVITAVKTSQRERVEILLDEGADINARDDSGNTCIHWAVFLNKTDILDLLLSRGSDTNITNKVGDSPVLTAIQHHQSERLVSQLIKGGADIEIANRLQQTPLHWAVQLNRGSIVDVLLEANADVNSIDYNTLSPLHVAVFAFNNDIVKQLLSKGADVEGRNFNHFTPLMSAIYANNLSAFELLLQNGAKVNVENKFNGWTALQCAVYYQETNFVRVLLNAGAYIDDNRSYTIYKTVFEKDESCLSDDLLTIKTALMHHIIKMKVASLRYSTQDVAYDLSHYKSFQRLCAEEFSKFKGYGEAPLYLVFEYTDNPTFVSNHAIQKVVECDNLEAEFPIYSAVIKFKYKEAKRRNSLLDGIKFNNFKTNTGNGIKKIFLPNEIKRKILCHLSDDDLEKMCKKKSTSK